MINRKDSKEIEKLLETLRKLKLIETAIVNGINELRRDGDDAPKNIPRYQQDRGGREIQIGQKVLFLTTGKFKLTGGTVIPTCQSNNHFVLIIDNKENKIRRKSYNLQIIK